jgi:hypothetical protein
VRYCTMVCTSAAQGAATIVFACLARAAGTSTENKGDEALSSLNIILPRRGLFGGLSVTCHVSNHNLGLGCSSSSTTQESQSDAGDGDDDSTSTIPKFCSYLQQQCWRNTVLTQTMMIQDAGLL